MTSDLYAVVEHNQASGQPVDDQTVFAWSLDEAREEASRLTDINRQQGRREHYYVYLLERVEEDEG